MTIGEAYAALGLDPSSTTPDEGHSRFRELIRFNHPDGKPSHEQARAVETTRVIVEACALLRTAGFPRVTACYSRADTKGLGYARPAAAELEPYDPLAWLDGVWREFVRGNPVRGLTPAFGIRFALGAWTVGREIIWGDRRRFK